MDGKVVFKQEEIYKVIHFIKFRKVMICNIIEFFTLVYHNSCEVGKKEFIFSVTLFLFRYELVEGRFNFYGVF